MLLIAMMYSRMALHANCNRLIDDRSKKDRTGPHSISKGRMTALERSDDMMMGKVWMGNKMKEREQVNDNKFLLVSSKQLWFVFFPSLSKKNETKKIIIMRPKSQSKIKAKKL